MRGRTAAIIGSIALVAIILLAYTSSLRLPSPPASPTGVSSSIVVTANNNSGISTTLEDIAAGKFPTASDKEGSGGVTVTVRNMHVLYVRTESDGDWHVGVTEGTFAIFITEITPAYQASEGKPPVGSSIDETGVPYCDTAHETESWHGNTCWEIHPVTAWQLSSSNFSSNIQSQTVVAEYSVAISYGQDPIPRGSTQTITAQVRDSDGPVGDAAVSVEVDYASGFTVHTFSCVTSSDGVCSISWEIGPTSTPGTFEVIVEVGGNDFHSSFSVTE